MSRLSLLLGAALLSWPTFALNHFDCVRDLLPITTRDILQAKRKGFEEPFLVQNGRYLVFPEVRDQRVSGFYIYNHEGAWYFDAVERDGKKPIKSLEFDTQTGMMELVAQPNGIETVSLLFLPGFDPKETDKHGPVMLGSSILPVVGGFVSRPAQRRTVYNDPSGLTEGELKRWMFRHTQGRRPATEKEMEPKRTLVHMASIEKRADLWMPIKLELEARKAWIQTHNLDEAAFKKLSFIMETTCKE